MKALWVGLQMLLLPAALLTMHVVCAQPDEALALPLVSRDWSTLFDWKTFLFLVLYGSVMDNLRYLPLARYSRGRRLNGFPNLLILLVAIPAGLAYFQVPLGILREKYLHLMTSCILISFPFAVNVHLLARAGDQTINPEGNTGSLLVDMFYGRYKDPVHFGINGKAQNFRFRHTNWALLNGLLVLEQVLQGQATSALVLVSGFQLLYSMDALYFEGNYPESYEAATNGFGWSMLFYNLCYPFLPTLITMYVINHPTTATGLPWYILLSSVIMKGVGYIIFRASENQRCQLVRNSSNSDLKTMEMPGGGRLLLSGWWGLVRHPTSLGEILMQWSWVLAAGRAPPALLVLPMMTTFGLVLRAHTSNQEQERKYGRAWQDYTQRVRYNLLPGIF